MFHFFRYKKTWWRWDLEHHTSHKHKNKQKALHYKISY